MQTFELMNIPKCCKLSYFLKPEFFDDYLNYLVGISGSVFNSSSRSSNKTVNDQITNMRKPYLEIFLDLVSIEFNKHDIAKSLHDDNPDQEPVVGLLSATEIDTPIIGVELFNNFLTFLDIEIILSWYKGNSDDHDHFDFQLLNINKQATAIGLLNRKENKFPKADTSRHDEMYEIEEQNCTDIDKDLRTSEKKRIQGDVTIDRKIPSEIYELELHDLIDLVDQLYIFMSVLFCACILGKRGAWGITQLHYLQEESKKAIKKWGIIEAKYQFLDLSIETDLEELRTFVSLNLDSPIMGTSGWLNVSSNVSELKYRKELEDVKLKNQELNLLNLKVSHDFEQNESKMRGLYEHITKLSRELEEYSDREEEYKLLKKQIEISEIKCRNYERRYKEELDRLTKDSEKLSDTITQFQVMIKQRQTFDDIAINEKDKTIKDLEAKVRGLVKTGEDELKRSKEVTQMKMQLKKEFEQRERGLQNEIKEYENTVAKLRQEISDYENLIINKEKNEWFHLDEIRDLEKELRELIKEHEKDKKEMVAEFINKENAMKELLELKLKTLEERFHQVNHKENEKDSDKVSTLYECNDRTTELESELEKLEYTYKMKQLYKNGDFQSLIELINKGKCSFEMKVRIDQDREVTFLFDDKIVDVEPLVKEVSVRIKLHQIIQIIKGNIVLDEIHELYHEEMINQLKKHYSLKKCCDQQRTKIYEYHSLVETMNERDLKVWRWVHMIEERVNKSEEIANNIRNFLIRTGAVLKSTELRRIVGELDDWIQSNRVFEEEYNSSCEGEESEESEESPTTALCVKNEAEAGVLIYNRYSDENARVYREVSID